MRRPRWLPLVPPPASSTDQFDLPQTSLLSGESSEEREARLRLVRRQAFRFYSAVRDQLGEQETKTLFRGFWKRREGGQRGSRKPERDEALLKEYDERLRMAASQDERSRLPAEIAREADARSPGVFGNSAGAIEKQIRRLLVRRSRRQALIAARSRRWRGMWGQPQTGSLLTDGAENESSNEPDTN